jgi:O-antigen/teichoic acid export membrane protein
MFLKTVSGRIAFGAGAHWLSRGVAMVLGLVLLPVLFANLSKSELGIWLLLGQTWATMGFLDFGLSITLTRMIAFAKGRSGSSPSAVLNSASTRDIADLLTTGRRMFWTIALVSSAGAFLVGLFYLSTIDDVTVEWSRIVWAWGILCLSFAATTLAAPWACLLQGTGYIGWDVLIASSVQVITLLSQVVAASMGGGIVALALLAVCGAALQRIIYLKAARRNQPSLFKLRGQWRSSLMRKMIPLSCRAWLTTLGGVLVIGSDQFIVTSLMGSEALGPYRAAWILIHNLTIVALTFSSVSPAFVSHYWEEGSVDHVHRILERNVRFGWLVMLLSTAVLAVSGEALFGLWLGDGNFVGHPVLVAFLIAETLETQSFTISQISRATGEEAFAASSIIGGVLKVGLSILLGLHYGLLGVALGTTIALALTNHWYMPYRGLTRLAYPKLQFIYRLILPIGVLAAMAVAILWAIQSFTRHQGPLLEVFWVVASAGLIFTVAAWAMVLHRNERHRILSMVNSALATLRKRHG